MIGVATVILLALAAVAYVVAPILRGPRRAPAPVDDNSEARARKDAALAAIIDLEADYAMGKLGTDDLESLRRAPEAQALRAIRTLRGAPVTADHELEREIAAVRSRLKCPNCGAARGESSPCPACGAGSPTAPP